MSRLDPFRRWAIGVSAAGFLVAAVVVAATGTQVAWLLLAFVAAVALPSLVISLKERRIFEPLTVIAAVTLVSFVARPLQLFLGTNDLSSWYSPDSAVDALLALDNQEIALFVTRDLQEPLSSSLTRAIAAVALFTGLATAAYFLPWGAWLGRRLARVGREARELDVRAVVIACLAIALVGQVIVLIKVGGPVDAARNMLDQGVLNTGLVYQVLLGFGTAGILIWAAWSPPKSRNARIGLAVAVLEVCAFYAISGTRTRVVLCLLMLAVISHYLWRPWRLRELLAGVLVVLVFSSMLLAIRQATSDRPLGEAVKSAPDYILDPRGVLNDFTEFDEVFIATTVIGSDHRYRHPAPFLHGEGIVDAFRSYIPASIDSGKPESGDIAFRKLIWGNELKSGRPYTVVGDFWHDFGFPGVAVGALIFGMLARALLGLVSTSAMGAGREHRVVLYGIGLVLLYTQLITTYSVALGYVITLALPYLAAVYLFGPLRERLGPGLTTVSRVSERASAT
jgi:oligosaccharide repeat unit polymerase